MADLAVHRVVDLHRAFGDDDVVGVLPVDAPQRRVAGAVVGELRHLVHRVGLRLQPAADAVREARDLVVGLDRVVLAAADDARDGVEAVVFPVGRGADRSALVVDEGRQLLARAPAGDVVGPVALRAVGVGLADLVVEAVVGVGLGRRGRGLGQRAGRRVDAAVGHVQAALGDETEAPVVGEVGDPVGRIDRPAGDQRGGIAGLADGGAVAAREPRLACGGAVDAMHPGHAVALGVDLEHLLAVAVVERVGDAAVRVDQLDQVAGRVVLLGHDRPVETERRAGAVLPGAACRSGRA
jgi:hypothetical protein